MEIKAEEISQIIKEQIKDFDKKVELSETGIVLSVVRGSARMLRDPSALGPISARP